VAAGWATAPPTITWHAFADWWLNSCWPFQHEFRPLLLDHQLTTGRYILKIDPGTNKCRNTARKAASMLGVWMHPLSFNSSTSAWFSAITSLLSDSRRLICSHFPDTSGVLTSNHTEPVFSRFFGILDGIPLNHSWSCICGNPLHNSPIQALF
jgi:hypothetical protein